MITDSLPVQRSLVKHDNGLAVLVHDLLMDRDYTTLVVLALECRHFTLEPDGVADEHGLDEAHSIHAIEGDDRRASANQLVLQTGRERQRETSLRHAAAEGATAC